MKSTILYENIKNENPINFIMGPCVIESYDMTMNLASKLKIITDKLAVPFVFKASFDKANRSSSESYRGCGINEGMSILKEIKSKFDINITTDIHRPEQAEKVAEIVDIIQIPAFLCRQTDLIEAAAETGKIINIKKGQFLAPWDIQNVINKITAKNNQKIIITERGVSFGYNNLIVDMTGIIEMKEYGYPIFFDATHSVQKPCANTNSSGGNIKYVPGLAKASAALGIAGIFFEVHPDPINALCDSDCMIKVDILENLISQIKDLDTIVK